MPDLLGAVEKVAVFRALAPDVRVHWFPERRVGNLSMVLLSLFCWMRRLSVWWKWRGDRGREKRGERQGRGGGGGGGFRKVIRT